MMKHVPSLKERLEATLGEKDIKFLRKLFVAFVLILLFWGTWELVVSLTH